MKSVVSLTDIGSPAEDSTLTERQQRERDYHSGFAAKHAARINEPPALDILAPERRRWWNSYWQMYGFVLEHALAGKRAFVPGCGFGADACRLAVLGADVYASDISPEIVDMARQRAVRAGFCSIHFDSLPAEQTGHPDDFFDLALFTGVFHHIDIASGLQELRRIMKPGGIVIAHEVYSHSAIQRIRDSWFVRRVIYPSMSRFIYGGKESYITDDEHKLNQREFAMIYGCLSTARAEYFNLFQGRVFPSRMARLSRLDRRILRGLGPLAGLVAGRVVFTGNIRK